MVREDKDANLKTLEVKQILWFQLSLKTYFWSFDLFSDVDAIALHRVFRNKYIDQSENSIMKSSANQRLQFIESDLLTDAYRISSISIRPNNWLWYNQGRVSLIGSDNYQAQLHILRKFTCKSRWNWLESDRDQTGMVRVMSSYHFL